MEKKKCLISACISFYLWDSELSFNKKNWLLTFNKSAGASAFLTFYKGKTTKAMLIRPRK